MDIDSLISTIVKTDEEIAIENKHSWIKHEPPLICFNNCFNKSEAANPHNWKNIFPEYYWLAQRRRTLMSKIKHRQYQDDNELAELQQQIKSINQRISTTANPREMFFH